VIDPRTEFIACKEIQCNPAIPDFMKHITAQRFLMLSGPAVNVEYQGA
jgi:hypothetical protein